MHIHHRTNLLAFRELRESELRLRTLVETIPDLVWLKDPQGVYLSCNPQFERLYGASEAEIVGKTDDAFVSREMADFFRRHDRRAMAVGGPIRNEEWLTFADGGYRGLFETVKTPMVDAGGSLVGVLGVARDISERKAAEDELRATRDEIHRLNAELEARVRERTQQLEAANREGVQPYLQGRLSHEAAYAKVSQPLREFMLRQTRQQDLALMVELSKAPQPESIDDVGNLQLIPAFMLSELRAAFQIGFVVFLPFLLIDLIVSSILMALGMMMMPPVTIALPLKVLMFVLVDGWSLILRALLGSFH